MASNHILVVEDDPAVLHMLQSVLEYGGFSHEAAGTADLALTVFRERRFDAVLLDLGLPDIHGSELITSFREHSDVPILVVSGHGAEQQRVDSLDLGADDFILKPFLPGELLARIRAAIRRIRPAPRTLRFGDVEFDPDQPVVRVKGELVSLRKHEYALLSALARHPNTTVPKEDLCEAVWGSSGPRTERNLRVLVNHLRSRIETDPEQRPHIIAQRGFGYRLET